MGNVLIGVLMGGAVALPFGMMTMLLIRDLETGPRGRNKFQLIVVGVLMLGSYLLMALALSRISGAMAAGGLVPQGIQLLLAGRQLAGRLRELGASTPKRDGDDPLQTPGEDADEQNK